jgi:hypothetical protein
MPHDRARLRRFAREPVEVDREVENQELAQQERGHRVEDERAAGQEVVDRLVAPHDLQHAERHGRDDRDRGRDAHEDERLRQVLLDEGRDALVLLVGVAQVEVQHQVAAVIVELVPDREVIAVQLVELLDLNLGCALTESGPRRAARDDVLEEEHEQRHPEDDDRRLDDAAGQIADHSRK